MNASRVTRKVRLRDPCLSCLESVLEGETRRIVVAFIVRSGICQVRRRGSNSPGCCWIVSWIWSRHGYNRYGDTDEMVQAVVGPNEYHPSCVVLLASYCSVPLHYDEGVSAYPVYGVETKVYSGSCYRSRERVRRLVYLLIRGIGILPAALTRDKGLYLFHFQATVKS